MKKIEERTLEYNIGLVQYENPHPKDGFDLTTIHSLLIDHNPKFVALRQLIVDYNTREARRQVHRPHLQRPFIERLYKMLSQLTRICHIQNQLKFLDKIYVWAFQESPADQEASEKAGGDKQRPDTASTRTRPISAAYTKRGRPDSALPSKKSTATRLTFEQETISQQTIDSYPKVDFKQLRYGEKEFFLGHRTLHPQEERPRARLKEYDRRKYLEDDSEEEKQIRPIDEPKRQMISQKIKLPEIPLVEEVKLQLPELRDQQGLMSAQNGDKVENAVVEGVQNQDNLGLGEEDVNIDDIVAGEEDPGQQEEEVEVIDKLRPRVKVYGNPERQFKPSQHQNFHRGLLIENISQNRLTQVVEEDKLLNKMMQDWAATKNRVKVQQRRRAQSARIMAHNVGVPFQKYQPPRNAAISQANVVDLSQHKVVETKTSARPITAFVAKSDRVFSETIKNSDMTGRLGTHIRKENNNFVAPSSMQDTGVQALTVFAAKPKKKTFEQILRQAEGRVQLEAQEEIEQVKETLTTNKIALGANKIYKSLSHHETGLAEGEFVGLVTGQGMINNPFFKVAKKKKKKKGKK